MPNVHIHLHVADLDASREFYERFLGVAPAKAKPGYVKFLPPQAPLNLALSSGQGDRGGTVSHFGFQVETKAEVLALLERAKVSGLPVREELGTDCCYANQDKFWVVDPNGIEWEVYHLNYDLKDEVAPTQAAAGCCTPLAKIGLGKRV